MDIKAGNKVVIINVFTLEEKVAEVIEVFKCLDSKDKVIIDKVFYRIRNLSNQKENKEDLISEQEVIGLVMDRSNKDVTEE